MLTKDGESVSFPLKLGDKIIYTNMPKLKHLPKTKKQSKYLGPYTVSKITDSHVTIYQTELGAKKDNKILNNITRPYFERNTKKMKVNLDSSISFDASQVLLLNHSTYT